MLTPSEPFRHRTKEDYAYEALRAGHLALRDEAG